MGRTHGEKKCTQKPSKPIGSQLKGGGGAMFSDG